MAFNLAACSPTRIYKEIYKFKEFNHKGSKAWKCGRNKRIQKDSNELSQRKEKKISRAHWTVLAKETFHPGPFIRNSDKAFFLFFVFYQVKGREERGTSFFKWSNGMPSTTWEAFNVVESTLQREWDAETVQGLFV